MTKKILIFLIIFLLIFTTGCFKNSSDSTEQIEKEETVDNAPTTSPDKNLSSGKGTSEKVQFYDEETMGDVGEFESSDSREEKENSKEWSHNKEMPKEEENNEESDGDNINYVGSWQRIGLFVDGAQHEFAAETLVLKKESFVSSTYVCSVQGKLSVSGNQLSLYDITSNCPSSPSSMTSTFSISDDGNTLTIITVYSGVEVKDIFQISD
jgi:hypothetical protein